MTACPAPPRQVIHIARTAFRFPLFYFIFQFGVRGQFISSAWVFRTTPPPQGGDTNATNAFAILGTCKIARYPRQKKTHSLSSEHLKFHVLCIESNRYELQLSRVSCLSVCVCFPGPLSTSVRITTLKRTHHSPRC